MKEHTSNLEAKKKAWWFSSWDISMSPAFLFSQSPVPAAWASTGLFPIVEHKPVCESQKLQIRLT